MFCVFISYSPITSNTSFIYCDKKHCQVAGRKVYVKFDIKSVKTCAKFWAFAVRNFIFCFFFLCLLVKVLKIYAEFLQNEHGLSIFFLDS